MSIANLTSEQNKDYLTINVKRVNTQELNITNFTVGAIGSGVWNPNISMAAGKMPQGAFTGLTNADIVEARFRKINNLVECYVGINFIPTVAGTGSFFFDNLPIGKTSTQFISTDNAYGQGTAFTGSVLNQCVAEGDVGGGTTDIAVFTPGLVNAVQNRIYLLIRYTTD